jgi:hypothetical protein
MGTKYSFDKEFTDWVHQNLAIEKIYNLLDWIPQLMDGTISHNVDMNNGVDYFFVNKKNHKIVTTQERFRDSYYQKYNDFTIRYERESNPHPDRLKSEFFKIKSDYFVYGIINESKYRFRIATDFIKFAVIDIKKLMSKIDEGQIIIEKDLKGIYSIVRDNIMVCPVVYNRDDSSSFVTFNISQLTKLFKNDDIVLLQKGEFL